MPGCKTCVHESIHKCSWPGTECPDWNACRQMESCEACGFEPLCNFTHSGRNCPDWRLDQRSSLNLLAQKWAEIGVLIQKMTGEEVKDAEDDSRSEVRP
ncbi:hypothetical protein LCGC14_1102550 [marine sediment metagenome]|uniref:Uncharacterized protein n=1 Tax=marine sediment metagenome TaxID=412755 RepID=A0A0F9MDM1_9ZZZZ